MHHEWNDTRAEQDIQKFCTQVQNVEIVKYKRSLDLGNIPVHKAYEMNAVHIYVDILNLDEILVTESGLETEYSHKRALRFFDSHFRAIRYILNKTDAIFVDFHNQRLHAVIPRPYGDAEDEQMRLDRAVAISKLIIDVVETQRKDEGDGYIPAAEIRIGIDSGIALAVNNGRRSHKEPLFLGNPANHAAKHSAGNDEGIFLTSNAREILGLSKVTDTKKTKLSNDQIQSSVDRAKLDKEVTHQQVIDEVCGNMKLLKDFSFNRITPPLKGLDFSSLYYKSAKRQEILSIYADIDGFTNFVEQNIDSDDGKTNIVRCLHVLRSELDASLSQDFLGRRVRFIGDCVHGIICEGTAKTTDYAKTVDVGTEAVSGLRSSFNLALAILNETFNTDIDLGLSIGYDFGDNSITRIGKQGESVRCSLGLSTINAETEQQLCQKPDETRIGENAYNHLSASYRKLFKNRSALNLTFSDIKQVAQAEKNTVQKHSMYDSTSHSNSSILKAHANLK